MKKQIIAIGGRTGTSIANWHRLQHPRATPEELASMLSDRDLNLERYIFAQSGKAKPRVCFLATAVGDRIEIYNTYYEVMKRLDCVPTHLSLFAGTDPDLRKQLLDQDVIFIYGGNTRNMITLWKEWGVDQILREAYEKGIVLAGQSAGSICWFEQGVTDSIPGSLTAMNCLGFLKGSNCPHYDGEIDRRPSYHRLMRERKIVSGVAADDGVGIHFVDGEIKAVASNTPTGKAYRVELTADGAIEETVIQDHCISLLSI